MGHVSGRSVFIHAVLSFLLFACTATRVDAQTFTSSSPAESIQAQQPFNPSESRTIGWGVKSGVQWPSFDDLSNGLDHIGGMIGVFIDFNPHGRVGVTGDLLFVNSPQSDEPGTPSGSLHFLEVPVMLRLRQPLTANNRYAVYGIVGPAFSLKLSGDDEFQDQTIDLMLGGGLQVKDIWIEGRIKRGSRDRVLAGVTSSFTQQTFAILVGFRMHP